MAIFHSSSQIISRSKGKSSVGASAYRSGEKIYNERDGITHDYTRKKGVVFKEILAPINSPEWVRDREKLWNEVEKVEKRKDSQLAREMNIALPKEFNREKQIELLRNYVNDSFVSIGMIADIVIHDTNNGNPHAHIMLTMREITKEGFGKKNREWNNKEYIEKWRSNLAIHINKGLEELGIEERVDHRSYKEQGIDKIATKHEGYVVRAMENRGVETDRGNENRKIVEENKKIEIINESYEILLELRGDNDGQRVRRTNETKRGIEITTEGREKENRRNRDKEKIIRDTGRSIFEGGISGSVRRDARRDREKGKEYFERLRKNRKLEEERERELREFEEKFRREIERSRTREERNRRYEKEHDYEMEM